MRRAGIAWTVVISSLYIIAQMVGVGTLMESVTGLPWAGGVILLGGVITLYVAFGGMTGVTLTQMLQFWIMLTAMIVPLFVLMSRHSYPELLTHAFRDTGALVALDDREPDALTVKGTPTFSTAESERFPNARAWLSPFNRWNLFGSLSLLMALVCGTAGLPHILARFYTNPNAAKARWSTVWVLVFIGVFYITTPIWGTYARMALGPEAVLFNEAGKPNPNTMMLITSADAGDWAKALIAGGAIAALLSTVSGLLIALSSAFAHDFYGTILRPAASDRQKIIAAKMSVVAFGALAVMVGLTFRDRNIAWMVGLAFAVAASTFFPLLVCGIWWPKMTEKGAFAGIMTGGLISAVIVIGKLANFWSFEQPAIISVPLAFLAIYVVSKATYSKQSQQVRTRLETAFRALHHPGSDNATEEPVAARGE